MSREIYGGFRIESFDSKEFFTYLPSERGGYEVIVSNDKDSIREKIDEFNQKYS
jgi:hypothetical protein